MADGQADSVRLEELQQEIARRLAATGSSDWRPLWNSRHSWLVNKNRPLTPAENAKLMELLDPDGTGSGIVRRGEPFPRSASPSSKNKSDPGKSLLNRPLPTPPAPPAPTTVQPPLSISEEPNPLVNRQPPLPQPNKSLLTPWARPVLPARRKYRNPLLADRLDMLKFPPAPPPPVTAQTLPEDYEPQIAPPTPPSRRPPGMGKPPPRKPPTPLPPAPTPDDSGGGRKKRRPRGKKATPSSVGSKPYTQPGWLPSMKKAAGMAKKKSPYMDLGDRDLKSHSFASWLMGVGAAGKGRWDAGGDEGLNKAAGGIGKMMSTDRTGHVLSGGMDAIAGVGMFAGGPAGMAVAGLASFSSALFTGVERLRDWGSTLHENNMRFAEYSARMAQVQAEQEVRDIHLSQQRGDRRADSAKGLAESKSRLDKNLAPWEDMWANFQAKVGNKLFDTMNKILVPLNILATSAGILDAGKYDPAHDVLKEIDPLVGKYWDDTYGRPHDIPPSGGS